MVARLPCHGRHHHHAVHLEPGRGARGDRPTPDPGRQRRTQPPGRAHVVSRAARHLVGPALEIRRRAAGRRAARRVRVALLGTARRHVRDDRDHRSSRDHRRDQALAEAGIDRAHRSAAAGPAARLPRSLRPTPPRGPHRRRHRCGRQGGRGGRALGARRDGVPGLLPHDPRHRAAVRRRMAGDRRSRPDRRRRRAVHPRPQAGAHHQRRPQRLSARGRGDHRGAAVRGRVRRGGRGQPADRRGAGRVRDRQGRRRHRRRGGGAHLPRPAGPLQGAARRDRAPASADAGRQDRSRCPRARRRRRPQRTARRPCRGARRREQGSGEGARPRGGVRGAPPCRRRAGRGRSGHAFHRPRARFAPRGPAGRQAGPPGRARAPGDDLLRAPDRPGAGRRSGRPRAGRASHRRLHPGWGGPQPIARR